MKTDDEVEFTTASNRMALVLGIVLMVVAMLVATCAHAASDDQWSGKDKKAHKIIFGVATEAAYVTLRYNDVPHAAEWAAGSMFVAGVAKEYIFDPSRFNKYPSQPSWKDIGANAIGIGTMYIGIKIGEHYGQNPFYWEW